MAIFKRYTVYKYINIFSAEKNRRKGGGGVVDPKTLTPLAQMVSKLLTAPLLQAGKRDALSILVNLGTGTDVHPQFSTEVLSHGLSEL